jgi:beta-mannosidase
MDRITLDGQWKLYYFPQGKYEVEHPNELAVKLEKSVEAIVPGNVELDLSRAGELPEDLFFGDNITKLKPYELYEWWYVKEFETPKNINGKEVELLFHGVDCLAEYWLNGEELGSTENMFIEHSFDVSGRLQPGTVNKLAVRLRSPIIEAMSKEYDPLNTYIWGMSIVEHIWIRKAAHSYGWDIMARALSAGLWRSVELVVHEQCEVKDLYFITMQANEKHAALQAHYELKLPAELLHEELYLNIEGYCGDSSFKANRRLRFKAGQIPIEIDNPKLWWPRGYGNADLYDTLVQVICNGQIIASKNASIGIRTVELIRRDNSSTGVGGQFLFKVNGTPILCKGSNWVPADAFHSRDAARYGKMFEMLVDIGCNIVRCWGGNVYEDHAFYESCNKNGIMVWQDFAFACAVYPQDPEFLKLAREEAVAVVRKLRNHPSIILWSGDNECDSLLLTRGIDPNDNRLTREVLPQVVYQCDPYRNYLPSSPYVSREVFKKRDAKLMPEDHLWGPRDYYKSRYYTESHAYFVSEIGYHGCPNLSSIKRFIDKDHLWPWKDDEQWIIHSTDILNNPARVKLMADQIKELFGINPDSIEDFILASQISQAEAKKFFIESTRLHKWNRTGIIWWNLIDGWPQFSDAVVDYYFGKKLAYHYIKRIQQPVCIMIDELESWHLKAVVGNDSREDAAGIYRIWDGDTGETLLQGSFEVKANENVELGKIRVSHSDKRLLLIGWSVDGKSYGNHYMLGFPPFDFQIYKGWIKKIAELEHIFDSEAIGR